MESLCIVDEASLETTMGVWADKDVQCAFHPSSSVIPSDLRAGLQPSESIAFQETELDCPHLGSNSREEPESSSMLSHFTRLCESQRLRQPVARSSRSDPTHRLSYTSVPQVDKAGEPIGFNFFSRDPTTQQDLAGPREQAGAKEAARDYGLEVRVCHFGDTISLSVEIRSIILYKWCRVYNSGTFLSFSILLSHSPTGYPVSQF
jgi:hypothetical protein